jgi:hypothetical protein
MYQQQRADLRGSLGCAITKRIYFPRRHIKMGLFHKVGGYSPKVILFFLLNDLLIHFAGLKYFLVCHLLVYRSPTDF